MHREADSNNGPTQALTSVLPSMPFESWPAGQVVHESLPTALYVFTGQAAHKKGEKKRRSRELVSDHCRSKAMDMTRDVLMQEKPEALYVPAGHSVYVDGGPKRGRPVFQRPRNA